MASNTHHKIKSQCSVDSRHKMKDKHGHHAKKVPSKTKQKPQHRIQTEYSLGVRNIRTDDIITQDEGKPIWS